MKQTFMLYGLITGFVLLCYSTAFTQTNASSFSITTLDGQRHSLSEYAGKKLALVIIPSTEGPQDFLFLDSLNAIAARHADSLTVIGVPSYETGYQDDSLSSLTTFYDSLVSSPCIITQGMNTTKASAYQDSLFTWLTNASGNGHFNQDVEGIGQSFFIDNSGNLFAVFGVVQKFDDALVETILQPASTQSSQ